jgi:hypothetical protein
MENVDLKTKNPTFGNVLLCICKKATKKRTYHYINTRNQYGYPEVNKIECFLWVMPYKITPIEAHHNMKSAKRHLKGIRNKEPFYCA